MADDRLSRLTDDEKTALVAPFRPPGPDTGRLGRSRKPLPCERCGAAQRRSGYRLCQSCLTLQDAAREFSRQGPDAQHLALLQATGRTYDGRRLR